MVAATKTGRPKGLKRSKAPKRWRRILCAIPGYDPFRDSEDCWFDAESAQCAIDFIETCCTHIEGALAGQPFTLELWQKAIVANLFGWYRYDFLDRPRWRYSKALIYVPRKNGKTPLVAAIHNLLYFATDEAGQINNLAAASRDQASKLYRHISGMIKNEPEMQRNCSLYATTKSIQKPDESVTKVIPADDKVAHGDNPYFQAIDELHAQPDGRLYEALTSAMASANRINQLLLMITTADNDRPSVCNKEYDYACKVRDGIVNDASYLPVIYEAYHAAAEGKRIEDDWRDPEVWAKANPNLGVSVSTDYLRDMVKRAKNDADVLETFKRLHLNIRTQVAQHVMPMGVWDDCAEIIDWQKFAGQPCWAALDIGALRDFVDLVLLFGADRGEPVEVEYEDQHGRPQKWQFVRREYWLRHYCWLPETPMQRDERMAAQIQAWTDAGHILRTSGDVVDYDEVGADITRILKPYGLLTLAIDQGFQGMQITQDMQKIFGEERVVWFRQGILSMAAPFRELLQMIPQQRIHHDGDPVLRWMASNVVAEKRGGLTKPSKDKSPEKIDGITAATMAVGVAMVAKGPVKSVYESGESLFL